MVLEINSQGKPRPHSEPPGLVAGSLADHWQNAFRPGLGLCGWGVRGEVGLSAFFRDLVGLKVRWVPHFCSPIICLPSCAWKDSPPRFKSDGVIMELHDVIERRKPVIV